MKLSVLFTQPVICWEIPKKKKISRDHKQINQEQTSRSQTLLAKKLTSLDQILLFSKIKERIKTINQSNNVLQGLLTSESNVWIKELTSSRGSHMTRQCFCGVHSTTADRCVTPKDSPCQMCDTEEGSPLPFDSHTGNSG